MPTKKVKRRRRKPVRIELQPHQHTSSEDSEHDIPLSNWKRNKGGRPTLQKKFGFLQQHEQGLSASNGHSADYKRDEEAKPTAQLSSNEDMEAKWREEATLEPVDEDQGRLEEDEGNPERDDESSEVDEEKLREYCLIPQVPGMNFTVQQPTDYSDIDWANPPPQWVPPFQHLLLPDQDVNASLNLAKKVDFVSDNLQVKLMRLWSDYQVITKEYQCKMLATIRASTESDKLSLPIDVRALKNCIPIQTLSIWLTHICFECHEKHTYRYHLGLRNIIPFPQCHGEILGYNSDHFYVVDVAEVLSLALPSVWGSRSENYLPPYIKKLMQENGMDFETDITLSVSSDGVQYFKSSNISVWPIMAFIDGIPFHLQRKSIMCLGVLFARGELKHFQVNSMIENVVKQVERLNKWEFSWNFRGKSISSRVLISRVIADSPARAVLQGISNHNGGFGCNYCCHFQPGHYFNHFEEPSRPRTDDQMRRLYANDCFESMTVEARRGVKWVSPFAALPLNLVDGFPPDVMHCVHLGVMKLLLQLWITQPGRQCERQIFQLSSAHVDTLDKRLLAIRPPERTSRTPRPASKVGGWKAHELSMFMSHYGPILLRHILPSEYYEHFLDLVAGIAFLSHNITKDNVANSQLYLDRFSENIGKLYSRKANRFNVHLLRHLPRMCELHGILPLFSMYPFEAHNHTLGKYVKNPYAVVIQIFQKSAQRLLMNSREDAFLKDYDSLPQLRYKCQNETPTDRNMSNWEALDDEGSYYQVYYPGEGKPRILSAAYTAMRTRNSYTVLLTNGKIASILKYFRGNTTNEIVAIVEESEVTDHPRLGHIRYHFQNVGKRVISVKEIVEQVVVVESDGETGYSLYLNNIEHVHE